jgi:hypothetical protein
VAGGDIDAAAAAEKLELIQKDGFCPGTAGPLDVTDEDSARAWVADCVNNAGAARFASLEDQPFAEIPAPRPVTGPPGKMTWTAAGSACTAAVSRIRSGWPRRSCQFLGADRFPENNPVPRPQREQIIEVE